MRITLSTFTLGEEQKLALQKWEYTYNYIGPHQALGYLTPMEFYGLWKNNPIEKLMQFIDARLDKKVNKYL